ncbi:MAG: ATP-binding cassette domain-containing protein, partial [Erysipelotrichaceae bacterium]
MSVLSVKNLTKNFGGLCANSNINLEVNENELIGLIGPNGAGKTTLFNMLTGVYVPTSGTIEFTYDGKTTLLNNKKPYHICELGIARTFQNIRLFSELTVLDNVKIAMN